MMICTLSSPSVPGMGWSSRQMLRATRPVCRSLSLPKYDGSPTTMSAVAANSPDTTPMAAPESSVTIRDTSVLSMNTPPDSAHRLRGKGAVSGAARAP